MWAKRKLLLAALVFTALCYKVNGDGKKLLDMAPDAVTDLYNGCRAEALEKIIDSGLLKQELNHSKGFQKAWSAEKDCAMLIHGGRKEHTEALLAYKHGDHDFLKTFNDEVETLGINASTYENDFHFKSLHFLLMDSVTLLYPKKCKTLYVVPDKAYTAINGSKLRFGRFIVAQSSYSEVKTTDMAGLVLFNITSCFFANLGKNICSEEDEALLSPAEVFTVENVKEATNEDEDTYTEISLKHSKVDGSHNCYSFSRSPAGVSTQWLLLVLVALSLFIFNC